MMKPADYIAVASAVIAFAALSATLFHEFQRRKDQSRQRIEERSEARNSEIRQEVMRLFIASETVGLRTLDALGVNDGKDNERVELLKRTATQLRVVGHQKLACDLGAVCDNWRSDPAKARRQRDKLVQDLQVSLSKEP